MSAKFLVALAASVSLLSVAVNAQTTPAQSAPPSASQAAAADDPYLWLEEWTTPRAMAWVEAENAQTKARLDSDPVYQTFYDEALEIAGAKDRIPAPRFLNGEIYNFWQDDTHLRGIWRKTSMEDYRSAEPSWTTVLDIDALGAAEGKSWVLKSISCLEPTQDRCLIGLSDGGEDAVELREFDLGTGAFVEGGFSLPKGKHRVAWEDRDHLLVATDWTSESLTQSGYPYIVKRLTRGQPLAEAEPVFSGESSDGGYGVSPYVLRDSAGRSLAVISRPLDTFHSETYVLTERGVERLAIPSQADVNELVAGRVIVSLDQDWTVAGDLFASGSIVEIDLDALLADPGQLAPQTVWTPGPRDALQGIGSTRDYLLISTLENVRGRAWVYKPAPAGGWTSSQLDLPDNLAVGFGSTDRNSNEVFVSTAGFLDPSTLYLAQADSGATEVIKSLPAKFDAEGLVVEQLEAASSDGTMVPYFVVRRADIALDGTTPTILTAYGGFQVSRTPFYSGTMGKLWLERGGAFVLANIRGGGEFGPAWHQAGLGTKRQIIYDDFAAVGQDLIERGITSPRRLGIEGGSNGGLLMGVEMVQHPDLWNAVLIEVPLLDMIRISEIAAGASWQGEYGDVNADPEVLAFWQRTSPYQNLATGVDYPEPFVFTTTKDDRVGPQHARKFAAKLAGMGLPYYYYENTEGGHGSGADIRQSATTTALTMTYFKQKLMD